MKWTRRQFVQSLGAVGALTASGLASANDSFFTSGKSSKSVRYCVVCPELDDLRTYNPIGDLSWVKPDHVATIAEIDKKFRSFLTLADEDGKKIRRAFVPGLIHSARIFEDRIFMVSRGSPSVLYSLDANSLEVVDVRFPPDGYIFGGHIIPYLSQGSLAATLNSVTIGNYDAVVIFEANKLRELNRFSSQGFQAHDLTLSSDQKSLYVGHYGSNFKSGPYAENKMPPNTLNQSQVSSALYAASVTRLDPKSGKMLDRKSDNRNGPQGHIAVNARGQIYLPKNPPLLTSRNDEMKHPSFDEGTLNKEHQSEFKMTSVITGTTIVTDEIHQQFILPINKVGQIAYGSFTQPEKIQTIDLAPLGSFGTPFSIQFHPDQTHYIVSCEKGFAVFKRGEHSFVKELSYANPMAYHSHLAIG